MRKNHSKIVCIKLVHLPYLYIWCTVTLISNTLNLVFIFSFSTHVSQTYVATGLTNVWCIRSLDFFVNSLLLKRSWFVWNALFPKEILPLVMNLRVPKMRGISWLAAEPVSFSRRTLLQGVSNDASILSHVRLYFSISRILTPSQSCKMRRLPSSCLPVIPSVCPHGINRLPLDGFSPNLIFQYFSENFLEN